MASFITLTVVFGFYALFFCLDILEAAAKNPTTQSGLRRLADAALAPAVLTTLALTPVLLYAHMRALRRADARFVARLANATLLVAVVALVSGAGVRLGLGGADDIGWPNDNKRKLCEDFFTAKESSARESGGEDDVNQLDQEGIGPGGEFVR